MTNLSLNKILIIAEDQEDKNIPALLSAAKIFFKNPENQENNINIIFIPDKLAENIVEILKPIAKNYTHILAAANAFGKNFLPRLSAVLDVGMISDVMKIHSDNIFTRAIYAGNALETLESLDKIKILTIRTSIFNNLNPDNPDNKNINYNIIKIKSGNIQPGMNKIYKTYFIKNQLTQKSRPDLSYAKIIVSGGRGLQSRENFKLLEELADKLNAAVGASRAAVDAGFISNDFQIGQTGKIVAPDIYIAIGISGAIQHTAGIKDSKIIIAINKDPDAPIFQTADYGLVGDLFEILPVLIQSLKS